MPVLLADNGSEFSNPSRIEFDTQGNQRTHLFYCDPASPGQKGSAERNHELIRLVIPKGKPLDSYTQDDISLMMSHINSYCRPSLGNKTPYDMMCFLYGKEFLNGLGFIRLRRMMSHCGRLFLRKEMTKMNDRECITIRIEEYEEMIFQYFDTLR